MHPRRFPEPMSPSTAGPTRASLVSTAVDAGACLAVLVRDGRADLGRAGLLSGSARELAQALGPEAPEPEVARWLGERGAVDADGDARRFLAELRRLDPIQGSTGNAGSAAPAPAAPTHATEAKPTLAPEAWTRLARAVLAAGHHLRFRASGRSMRPFLPHGSLLEVEPRAFELVRLGEVVLHAATRAPLVAHRVVGKQSGALLTRGDSNARLDRVAAEDFLGVVVARESGGEWRAVSSGPARWLGLGAGLAYRAMVACARVLVLRPLRGTFGGPSLVRGALRGVLRVASGAVLVLERAAIRVRRPLDVLRAALLSTTEKDSERTSLYRRRAIQDFTALDENVRSGLTLLEEVLLARHPLSGRVLVLGCGPGRECLVLARRGCTVTGLDREPDMLVRARELAREAGLPIRYLGGEAADFRLPGETFEAVVVFSGLHDMLLPRARRVAMLRACRAHLVPGGRVLVTFLAAYRWPGEEPAAGKHVLEALNPEHERGDLYLLNEAIHVFPRDEDVAEEGDEAGLETVELFRDQRAYDRPAGQVRGYAVLRRPEGAGAGGAPDSLKQGTPCPVTTSPGTPYPGGN
jgi:SAM-dependent methyltransferase